MFISSKVLPLAAPGYNTRSYSFTVYGVRRDVSSRVPSICSPGRLSLPPGASGRDLSISPISETQLSVSSTFCIIFPISWISNVVSTPSLLPFSPGSPAPSFFWFLQMEETWLLRQGLRFGAIALSPRSALTDTFLTRCLFTSILFKRMFNWPLGFFRLRKGRCRLFGLQIFGDFPDTFPLVSPNVTPAWSENMLCFPRVI